MKEIKQIFVPQKNPFAIMAQPHLTNHNSQFGLTVKLVRLVEFSIIATIKF